MAAHACLLNVAKVQGDMHPVLAQERAGRNDETNRCQLIVSCDWLDSTVLTVSERPIFSPLDASID